MSLVIKGCSSGDLDLGVNFLYKFIIGFVPIGSAKIMDPFFFNNLFTSDKNGVIFQIHI